MKIYYFSENSLQEGFLCPFCYEHTFFEKEFFLLKHEQTHRTRVMKAAHVPISLVICDNKEQLETFCRIQTVHNKEARAHFFPPKESQYVWEGQGIYIAIPFTEGSAGSIKYVHCYKLSNYCNYLKKVTSIFDREDKIIELVNQGILSKEEKRD